VNSNPPRFRPDPALAPEEVTLSPSAEADFDELAAMRTAAMRESLQRLGRFDVVRARERLRASFVPEFTRHVVVRNERVGFVSVKPAGDVLRLEHLYVRPDAQGRGIGSAVLTLIFREADKRGLSVRVGALRGSRSNEFYMRHGFVLVEETEWDIFYVRIACARN
jgi:GNAT superfamily N-acetyltransferase